MDLKPGHKRTDVGLIPEEWETEELSELVDKTRAIRYGIVQPGEYDPSGRFMVRGQDYSRGWVAPSELFRVSDTIEHRYRNARLKSGDLIMTIVGAGTGTVEEIPEWLDGANLTQTTARIAINGTRADVRFCKFMLQSAVGKRQVANYVKGAAQPGLNCGDLERFVIPLPCKTGEQRAISVVLHDVDSLLAALQNLIAKKRDLKRAAMQQLLIGQTRLAGFSGDWQARRLGEIGSFSKGKGIRRDEVVAEGVPCIRYGEIYTHHNDYVRHFSSFIPANVAKQSQRLRTGDLLFAGSGETAEDIGKCVAFLGDTEACAGSDIVILSPIGHNSMYLGYLMNHQSIAKQKARMGQGDAVVHISARNLAEVSLRLPEESEQAAIATVLSDLDAELAALEQRLAKTRALKQGMMQELLTGRTRVV